MLAIVRQLISVTTNSAAFLRGARTVAPELFPAHPGFENVQSVEFHRPGLGLIAENVAPWLRRLAKEDVGPLRLHLRGLPMTPDLTPTEPWGVISDGDRGLEIWEVKFRRRSGTYEDKPRFAVTYTADRILRTDLRPVIGLPCACQAVEATVAALQATIIELGHPQIAEALEAVSRPADFGIPQWLSSQPILPNDASTATVMACDQVLRFCSLIESQPVKASGLLCNPLAHIQLQVVWDALLVTLESVAVLSAQPTSLAA